MANLPEAMKLITGTEPTPEQIQRVQAIAHSLDMSMQDAMFPILVALDQYHGIYTRLPGEVAARTKDLTTAAANNAATQAQAAVTEAVAGLVPSVEQAVADAAAKAVKRVEIGTSMFWVWLGMVALGAMLTLGWVLGSRAYYTVEAGKLTWGYFWQVCAWGIGLGTAAPALILMGLLDLSGYGEKRQGWQWVSMLLGFGIIILLGLFFFNAIK
ncbi:hypothetical protein BAE30_12450 [Acidithiobacillus caldus]|uniref:MobE n=1 Tax=Acidithiobacillus caldus TaxID=33059 RepID=A0A1E7YT30_9PROT|nr:hypothetical protein BAE30_12450 [Acidithiobacillus caldus]